MNTYPRPQLKRSSFLNLNGEWQIDGKPIQVPFPPQSRASGYTGEIRSEMTYFRTFRLPDGFLPKNNRLILHFGAVDQIAEVIVNNISLITHEGGYLPFSVDITKVLNNSENTLTVRVTDALDHTFPYGKQKTKRGGMWYTPVSGIWQTVWMEAVPEMAVDNLRITPDMTGITIEVCTKAENAIIDIPNTIRKEIPANKPVRIDIPSPHLWTVADPYLYTLTVSAGDDTVESYFALRTISIGDYHGKQRVFLNRSPVFLNGVLDQGYFPEGIFLPKSPENYRDDILNMKALGINLLRKHIKIEPACFYHECDKIGMLVMQDMVNSGGYSFLRDTALPTIGLQKMQDNLRAFSSGNRRSFFTKHCLDTQQHLYNHPSIIAYTIFNEGWGQFHADKHYHLLKENDPSRLYDATSGWFWGKDSDFESYHVYFRNKQLKSKKRPVLLSECGGYVRQIPGHLFNPNRKYGYGSADTEEALTAKIELMWKEMVFPSIPDGLAGMIYTQVSDIEDEINGFYTYDREVLKVNAARMRALAEKAETLILNKIE